jgi:hypothetical protein
LRDFLARIALRVGFRLAIFATDVYVDPMKALVSANYVYRRAGLVYVISIRQHYAD